jgi:DNA polymerase III epsilon subunit-like protein
MKLYGKEISNQYKYIFIDNFQSINDIQFNILKIFNKYDSYLYIFGNDYHNFDKNITNVKLFTLIPNYSLQIINNEINNTLYNENIINFNKNNNTNTIIFDTETTDFNGDIIQIAYTIIDINNNIIKKQNYFIKDRISSIQSLKIHNITTEKIRAQGIDFYCVMNEFINDLQNTNTLVGHNLDFDIRIILNNLRKYEIKIINNNIEEYNLFKDFKIYDTYKKTKLPLNKLYFNMFNTNIIDAHDASGDVNATLECYLELIK